MDCNDCKHYEAEGICMASKCPLVLRDEVLEEAKRLVGIHHRGTSVDGLDEYDTDIEALLDGMKKG